MVTELKYLKTCEDRRYSLSQKELETQLFSALGNPAAGKGVFGKMPANGFNRGGFRRPAPYIRRY